jgi:hypothetical protein
MLKLIDVSEVSTASIIRAITKRYIPEDSKLYTRRRENLKSHIESKYVPRENAGVLTIKI